MPERPVGRSKTNTEILNWGGSSSMTDIDWAGNILFFKGIRYHHRNGGINLIHLRVFVKVFGFFVFKVIKITVFTGNINCSL